MKKLVLTACFILFASAFNSSKAETPPVPPSENPCDNLPTLPAMRMVQLTIEDAGQLAGRFSGDKEMRGGFMPRDVARYLVCNGATEIYMRYAVKQGTENTVTVQYIGKGEYTLILQPTDIIPTCPNMCYQNN